MANIDDGFRVEKLSLDDLVLITSQSADPTTGAGYEAPVGSLYLRTTGQLYRKVNTADVDWVEVTDQNVKISNTDTTADYLSNKLVAGTNVTLTTLNSGGNEQIQIDATGGSGGGSPASPLQSVQFNSAGAFGGNVNFTYDDTASKVEIDGAAGTTRLVVHSGSDTLDTTQIDKSTYYIQVDGDVTYEGLRCKFQRSIPGGNGWLAYHYDQATPNFRLTDEDDDAPYVSFHTVASGTYDLPEFVSVFGARGSHGTRDPGTDTNGFAWLIGNNQDPHTLYSTYNPVMELDSQWLRIPAGTTAQRPATPANGMIRYNTTTGKLEGYESGAWQDLVQSVNVFGTEFQKAESAGVTTTTSTTFLNKLSYTTTNLPAGTYRIGLNYGWNHDNAGNDFEARILQDGTQLGEIHKQEPKDSAGSFSTTGTSQRYYTNRVFYQTLTAGIHTYDVEFRTDTAGTASSMWGVVLEIWRVA